MVNVLPTALTNRAQDQDYGTKIKDNAKDRLYSFKKHFTLSELSGALGDLGTLLPILLSLVMTGQVDLSASLIFGGLFNIVTGVVFRIPMCVQPMKSIASIALANHMSKGSVMGAGMSVGIALFFLGATRTIHLVQKYTPIAVVRGIQLGTSISFAGTAAELVLDAKSFGGEHWTWSNNYEWACVAFIVVSILFYRSKRIPTAMILFGVGLIVAFVKLYKDSPEGTVHPKIGVYTVSTTVPTGEEFRHGFLSAGLGQIPLTVLDSVIAVAALANDLFPEHAISTPMVSMSVGVTNLVGCFFGMMPFCHGSGGLAAQYRFGARSEVAIVVLGSLKIFFGLFFGSSLTGLIQSFPSSILGVMLFVSAVELGSAARTVNDGVVGFQKLHANFTIVVITAGMTVGFKNTGIGFVGGMVFAACFYLSSRFGGDASDVDALSFGHSLRASAATSVEESEEQERNSIHKADIQEIKAAPESA